MQFLAPFVGHKYLSLETFRVRTNAAGRWQVTRSRAILRNVNWHAVYLGSDTEAPASTQTRRIYVTPHLGLTVQLPFRNGHYVATSGIRFTVVGRSQPVMVGAEVVLQGRRGRGPWATVAVSPVVGGGRYTASSVTLGRGETLTLRWAYLGGTFRRWLPTDSRTRVIVGR